MGGGGDRHHLISYVHAERTLKFLMRTLNVSVPSAYNQSQHRLEFLMLMLALYLMRMIGIQISSLSVCSACA
jgi:hypothetical protein